MATDTFDVKVAANGRMVLPASVRAALGIMGESRVTLTLGDGHATLQPMTHHVLHAQALYRRHVTAGQSVDDFIDDRREDGPAGRHAPLDGAEN
jgi:AbrB family looped-hinge helix DNA binding protein